MQIKCRIYLYDFQVLKQLSKAGVTAGFIDGHRGFFVGLFFLTKKPERKKWKIENTSFG